MMKSACLVVAVLFLMESAAWGDVTLGGNAGASLTTWTDSVLLGHSAGANITDSLLNTFVGDFSGAFADASYNTGVGAGTGSNGLISPLSTGQGNTSVGYMAGSRITSGALNVFAGSEAGMFTSAGQRNTFVGYRAGYLNSTASYGTFAGYGAGRNHVTGGGNTFIGSLAGYSNDNGFGNTFIGNKAGYTNVNGYMNVFIGDHAGEFETGSNKLYIAPTNTAIPLIYGDFNTESLVINGSLNTLYVATVSDGRLKKDARPVVAALESVMRLSGVSYEWNFEDDPGRGFAKGRQLGLIAQDVEKVMTEVVQMDEKGYKAVSYEKIIPVLVEAIKEQDRLAREEDIQLASLKRELDLISLRAGRLLGRGFINASSR